MPLNPRGLPKRRPTTLQVLNTVADLLTDVGATLEHPGYILVRTGPLALVFGREGDRYVYEVYRYQDYLNGEQPMAVSDAQSDLDAAARPIVVERWIRRVISTADRLFAARP